MMAMVQPLALVTASTTYSSCGGIFTLPYFALANGEVKPVALVSILAATDPKKIPEIAPKSPEKAFRKGDDRGRPWRSSTCKRAMQGVVGGRWQAGYAWSLSRTCREEQRKGGE